MSSWWSKIKGMFGAKAVWRTADETPFGIPVLDLTPVTKEITAWTSDERNAERAISWVNSTGQELDPEQLSEPERLRCDLRYPVASELPVGLVFVPASMDDKWVIAHREGLLVAARSWTGVVEVVAEATRHHGELVVSAISLPKESQLRSLGNPIDIFDWLVRTHALGQTLPLPADDNGIALLESTPLTAFSIFGHKAFLAAREWAPPPPPVPIRSDGALLLAVRDGSTERIRELVERGEPIDAPTSCLGYTALSVALVRGDTEAVRILLRLGANPNVRADQGAFPLGVGIVHDAPRIALKALVEGGADATAVNDDGFGVLHAAAESGNASVVSWLVELGLDLEARTGQGHTALQIACGLGKGEAVLALLEAGSDPIATSPNGTAREIASAEGKNEIVRLLDQRQGRSGNG